MAEKNKEKKYPEPIVGALILNKKGKILLARGKKWQGKYTCFGGHVELGETTEEAVLREVKEETNLEVKIVEKLLFQDSVFDKNFHEKRHFVFVDFLCLYDGEDDLVTTNEEFEKDFNWFSVEEALKLDLAEGTGNIIKSYVSYLESKNALDSWKRCQADFENYKKDQTKYLEEFRKYAKADVIEQILPVVDNFEASLAHVPQGEKDNKWVEGIVYIRKQLEDVLKNNNIDEIEVKASDNFNPEVHEAVGGDGEKEKVKKVIRKGYKMNGRVLRAAKVEVE